MLLKRIKPNELYWQGHISLEKTANGLKPWRLPLKNLRLFDDALVAVAERPAGVRLRLITNSRVAGLEYKSSEQKNAHGRIDSTIDFTIDNKLMQSAALDPEKTVITFDNLPKGEKTIEFWLDNSNPPLTVKSLMIEKSASVAPDTACRPRWITYGSSITQCGEAYSPSRTWPALIAGKFDFNLTCLGFGSNCLIEPMMATTIRDLSADFISLKLGANCLGAYTPRTFRDNVIGMIKIIKEKHTEIPLAVISPILFPAGENTKNEKGLSIRLMRELLCDSVKRLQDCGIANIYYLNGLDLLNDEKFLCADKLHPNSEGYIHIADNLAPRLATVFGLN